MNLPQKPKLEDNGSVSPSSLVGDGMSPWTSIQEQEEMLIALIAHRTREVERLNKMVEVAQTRLHDARTQLDLLRARSKAVKDDQGGHDRVSTVESLEQSIVVNSPLSSRAESVSSRTQLFIPPMSQLVPNLKASPSLAEALKPASCSLGSAMASSELRCDASARYGSEGEPSEPKKKKGMLKIVGKPHNDLISVVGKSSTPQRLTFHLGTSVYSQHKRKLRTLVLNPKDDEIFATSALDGVLNLWEVQDKGSGAKLLGSTDCVSPAQRRWPEDIAWQHDGACLFAAYSADGGDCQVSLLELPLSENKRVQFLEEKPHTKGIINSISFMPWNDLCFVTGGSDHAVVVWGKEDDSWKPTAIYRSHHSSSVMGTAGLTQKKVVLSAGSDKRIVGFDVYAGVVDFKHLTDSKCMSVLPNPSDFNLFMVQTGSLGKQLRLFDIRSKQAEIHAFGFPQESSESQSALISQSWSPDGLYLSSGTVDPMIHIFDIRFNSHGPCQSLQAHQKRVFKALWHQSHPLLISISSDLNIGLHKLQ
ncbi:hypothetical protein HPP92_028371 [Vanilla planifolia]|uniref:Uncharacterized protein n=1 Tax=Vanilla planifolia TaxID=51239 RepID=A0A835P5L7_VANPL|nr:hypothetical protein HPP92_028371 [Vanilla planifolia]